jgi:hypothetical protein
VRVALRSVCLNVKHVVRTGCGIILGWRGLCLVSGFGCRFGCVWVLLRW